MTWWMWVLLGIVAYALVTVFVLALCKAAGDEDTRRGYK
jgi:hypothetical protein